MGASFRIGRIAGTEIKVHVTFLLLVAWYAWSAWHQGGTAAAVESVGFLLALFGCILAHEFGHILMARHYGVRTPDVILLPIGGMARLERIPEQPRQELLIALAGPLVTLVIAAGLAGVLSAAGVPLSFRAFVAADQPFIPTLMWVNVGLLAFNLLPAFPMDGGRVLRALLAGRLGFERATRIAARVGQGVAVVLGVLGLYGNAMLVLIAVFVFLGAGAEASMVERRSLARGVTVGDMMVTRFDTIAIHAPLSQAVSLLLATEQREFPVVDNLGRLEGLLTRDNLIHGLSVRGPASTVAEAMTPSVPAVPTSLPFDEALVELRRTGLPALPVTDLGGALVGLLTLDNITDLLLLRQVRPVA